MGKCRDRAATIHANNDSESVRMNIKKNLSLREIADSTKRESAPPAPAPNDSPYIGLVSSSYSKQTFSFGATMYFMWNPETSSNDIPVPLGDLSWQAYGDATFSNNNWAVQSDSSRSAGSFQASSSYPTWSSVFSASGMMTCQ